MEGRKGPEYIIRRRPGKSKVDPVPPLFQPRPMDFDTSAHSMEDNLTEFAEIVKSRERAGALGDFRVASYDVLADSRVTGNYSDFPGAQPADLDFATRSQKIVTELKLLQAQIICLQGVDLYEATYLTSLPFFASLTSLRSSSPATEGVAILYDSRVFAVSYSAKVNFQAAGHSCLSTPNTGLIAILKTRRNLRTVLVATARFWHQDYMGQLGQAIVLTKAVNTVLQGRSCPIVLAGCLDCSPGSALYRLLSTGEVAVGTLTIEDIADWSVCDTAVLGVGESMYETAYERKASERGQQSPAAAQISHLAKTGVEVLKEGGTRIEVVRQPPTTEPLKLTSSLPPLKSAYKEVTGREAFPTMYSRTVLGACDYVWVHGLRVAGVLKPPALGCVLQHASAPNRHFPSDHISVAADLGW